MLKYWHVSLLVMIALIWKVRPTFSAVDVCDPRTSNVSMYCTCEPLLVKNYEITCFLYGPVNPTSKIWGAFRKYDSTIALTLRSRLPYQLDFVPVRALQSLPSLETLTIQEANLGTLESGTMANMPKLTDLRLDRNEITRLEPHSISNLPKLNKLTLSENLLTEILADSFSGLDELELLFLDTNNITRIEACAFCSLHNLKELELWRNSITDLTEGTFRGLRYVFRLDLYNNNLQVLNANVFQSMPKLRELNLKNNMIHYINPRAFDGLKHLASLYLSDNQLKVLPDHVFQHVPMLISVDLSYNQLETIPSDAASSFRNALNDHFTLIFRGNPFKCSCDFSWVPTYIKKSKSQMFVKELRQMTCVTENGDEKVVHSIRFKHCVTHSTKPVPTLGPTEEPREGKPDRPSRKYESVIKDEEPKDASRPADDSEVKGEESQRTQPVTEQPELQQSPGSGRSVCADTVLLLLSVTLISCVWKL